MAKQPGVVVGIDLGSRFIKAAEVRVGRPPIVTNIGIAPTPEGAIDSSGVIDKAAVAATLKKLLADSGISTKQAAFSLAGQNSVVVRILEVPRMSPAELRQHMDWEIGRNIPFADTRVQSAYEVVRRPGADPNADNMEVVLAVAQQDAVDTLVTIADKLGLEPYAIDVEPLALARSLLLTQPDMQSQNVAVVNLGAESTSIDIYSQGYLSFPRILPTGGNMLTRAVAERLMIAEPEAEQLKVQLAEVMMDQIPKATSPFSVPGAPTGGFYTPGFASEPTIAPEPSPFMTPGSFTASEPSPDIPPSPFAPSASPDIPPSPFAVPGEPEPAAPPEPIAAEPAEPALPAQSTVDPRKREVFLAIYPLLEELVSEIRRSIEYFRSRHMDADVQLIVLTGGGAAMPNLDQFIASAVGVPTIVGNPFKGVQLSVKRHGPEYVAAHAHLMAVAVGMGLHASF
ncbi:MAG: type IV pilus assembly protein PilM [Fimbriimonadales bacterium]|nr:type IV pilus assembly protein PilM [Fimbriimonadales bacterium]